MSVWIPRHQLRAVVCAVALSVAACSGDGEPEGTPPSSAAGATPVVAGDCPVTAEEVGGIVGVPVEASDGCTFLNEQAARGGTTSVSVMTAPFDGSDETIEAVRTNLAALFDVQDVADVGDVAFVSRREGTRVAALVVFDGASQHTVTLGSDASDDEALVTLKALYEAARR